MGNVIANPNGAFGVTNLSQQLPPLTRVAKTSAAVVAGHVVSISSTGTVATTATDGVAVIGAAYTAAASGDTVQVVYNGPVLMSAGGATTLGTPVIRSATTAGYITSSATPVTGTVVGFAMGASASNQSWVYVMPGTNTSS